MPISVFSRFRCMLLFVKVQHFLIVSEYPDEAIPQKRHMHEM